MSKSMKLWLCIVMIAAIALMSLCMADYLSLSRNLRTVQDQLSESRAVWERIAADKEELQKELKSKKNELKEAQLSLSEANEKAEELKSDIETLKKEIKVLKGSAD